MGGRGFGGFGFGGRGGFIHGHRGFVGGIGFRHGFRGGANFGFGGFRAGFGGWYGRTPWSAGVWWPASYVPFYSYAASPYPYWAPPSPAVTVITVPPAMAAPSTIVINERMPAPPAEREEYQESRAPGWRASGSPLYLVATKSGEIWAARAYWVEDGALQIITRREDRKSIPVDQIDRALSEQLNGERRVEFHLP
jgi:hypothetical protein